MERRGVKDERIQGMWKELDDLVRDEEADNADTNDLSLDIFEETTLRMERYQVASPSDEQTKALLLRLTPLVAGPEPMRFSDQLLAAEPDQSSLWVRFIRSITSQAQVFSRMFWIISAVIMAAGALGMPLMIRDYSNGLLLVSSFVSVVSVFYAMRSYGTPMSRLEVTFPLSQVEMMMGRLIIIVLYDIVLAAAVSIPLSIAGLTGPLFIFITSWLVPLCLCTIMAFVSIVRFGIWIGGALSIAVWGVQLSLGDLLGPFYFLSDANYEFWGSSRLLALALTVILCLLAYLTMRSSRKGDSAHYDQA
ncbi:hypothetical protein [Paenibacillus eucommiae]|uniref:Zf-HC2 domain-containing protein n=1 Tax=Paenibacillus eucommiae TaxID=1355755 RepID=A0ABS4IPB5_9BACL|nr:hypothetical protein [Paenibacillus eucommiae]MBP1988766.1 hypothetical protein [Paenibacillus eucommiae]